jgi:hypothetical protein
MPRDSSDVWPLFLAIPALFLPAACVSGTPVASSGAEAVVAETTYVYRCENGRAMTVENRGTVVVVTEDGGEPIELPASPADSRARYGSQNHALLIEDGEALWMAADSPPETCLR